MEKQFKSFNLFFLSIDGLQFLKRVYFLINFDCLTSDVIYLKKS